MDEKKTDEQHFVVKCYLLDQKTDVNPQALIDFRSFNFPFIEKYFIYLYNILLFKIKLPRNLKEINGRPIEMHNITNITQIICSISNYSKILLLQYRRTIHVGINKEVFDPKFI